MWKKITSYMKKWNMLNENDTVIAGISGGADSVCLLYVLLELKKTMDFDIVVVHVNHQLRAEEADHDEEYVRKLCQEQGLPFECYSLDVEKEARERKQSIEEAARDIRRECFQKTMEKYNGTKIALAHHKNDNVETFFLNISRGSGLKGMAGIQPVKEKTIRPLLCVTRQEIEEFLKERNISYCDDKTNSMDDYTRNRIRNHVIPFLENSINKQAVAHIFDAMEKISRIQEYMEEEASKYYRKVVEEKESVQIKKEEFYQVPEVIREMLLHKALVKCTGSEKDIQSVHIQQLKELMEKQVGKKLDLPYNVRAYRCYEGVRIEKIQSVEKEEKLSIKIDFSKENIVKKDHIIIRGRIVSENMDEEYKTEKQYTKYFDYDIIKNTLEIRTRMSGDYIIINEEGKKQKLKSYFINEKIPQNERDHILLLTHGHHVLWVIGYRKDCTYQINNDTKHIFEITIDKGEKNYGRKN